MTTPAAIDSDTVEFIRLGYHDVSLDFTAPIRNYPTFVAAMAAIGGYNRFDGADTFHAVWAMASRVEVGRDASACLYVTLPFWTHQRHDSDRFGTGEKYTDEQLLGMAQTVIDWARTVGADVVRVWEHPMTDPAGVVWSTGDRPYRIRIWWD